MSKPWHQKTAETPLVSKRLDDKKRSRPRFRSRVLNGTALALLATAFLLGPDRTAEARCILLSGAPDYQIECTADVIRFLGRPGALPERPQGYSVDFFDLTGDIMSGAADPDRVLFKPAIGVVDTRGGKDEFGSIDFDGGAFGVRSEGHGIAYVADGLDGKDGEDRQKVGEDGKPGNRGVFVDMTLQSGFIVSEFVSNTPNAEAPSAAALVQSLGGKGGNGGKATNEFGSNSHGGDGAAGGVGGDVTFMTGDEPIRIEGLRASGLRIESIGGDGGKGGDAEVIAGKAFGGDGGPGGSGGSVFVDIETEMTIKGNAHAVVARSLGGAGGDGGSANGVLGSGSGGAAAGSGPAGPVSVTLGGRITTTAAWANGMVVQSVGGFAGDAGSGRGFLGYGANSESAGNGGPVTVTLEEGTVISTKARESGGAFIQSVGGGGGFGSRGSGLVGMGGTGSAGGRGGNVTVMSLGKSITTKGSDAPALDINSTGGGGGDAGSNRGVVAIGGDGGDGGNGGSVTVTNLARLTTEQDQSDGLVVQSIGGGGGSAHTTSGVVSMGGDGKGGGDGGKVAVTNRGSVSTGGDFSDAVFLQSLGGGGGDGSNATAVGLGVAIAYGGKGGSGGSGKSVSYDDGGAQGYSLSTSGDFARGLFAQSLGGGGGDGGNALTINTIGLFNIALGTSGSGNRAGHAGTVDVSTGADISTKGNNAGALRAVSQGGGGGSAGSAVTVNGVSFLSFGLTQGGQGGAGGSAGNVTVEARGDMATEGHFSDGLFAQSIGGGGGDTGTLVTVNGSAPVQAGITLGGSAGNGGAGKRVTVTAMGDIETKGIGARALVAQSVGGGGGSAGTVVTANDMSLINFALSIGAKGGAGGNAQNVKVQSSGALRTSGGSSTALFAQSLGGGGGTGSVTIAGSLVGLGNIDLAIGGSGGPAGVGGNVDAFSTGPISTKGDKSSGIVAQSISRSGGDAGFVVAGSGFSVADVNLGIGASGGSGGRSGFVKLGNAGEVSTEGESSPALVAQSIGGGGGNGGAVVAAGALSVVNVAVAVGGSGGTAGEAGRVELRNTGALTTEGRDSTALLAQSVGGTGGNGGFAATGGLTVGQLTGDVQVAVGGSGGKGGRAASVLAQNDGAIETRGFGSRGLFAQSVGGNGGNGGNTLSVSATQASDLSVQVLVDVGGSGGDGAKSAEATVFNTGTIATLGDYADAIRAQSIGGNGGNGGNATALHSKLSLDGGLVPDFGVRVATTIGGGAGDGMESDSVEVTNLGALSTLRSHSKGIYAQSVGGGGGSGGSAFTGVLDYQTVSGPFNPNRAEHRMTVSTNVGGTGGAGGDGKAVTVLNAGDIHTGSIDSAGIFAQSVGGGGGDGGGASSRTLFVTGFCSFIFSNPVFDCEYTPFEQPTRQEFLLNFGADFNIGGNGKAAGDGDLVTVENLGDIMTEGNQSSAIFAQSVGGGGGIGGNGNPGLEAVTDEEAALMIDALLQALRNNSPVQQFRQWGELTVSVGGKGGASGDGADVTVINSGHLSTLGEHSYGIEAQSIGGGGGQGGKGATPFLFNIAVGGTGSGGGQGGDVTVENSGSISTAGPSAAGIFAQSVGGGGGLAGEVMQALSVVGFDINMGIGFTGIGAGWIPAKPGVGGDGGDVTVISGAIETSGKDAHAIFAQSVGGSGGVFVGNGIESPGSIPSATYVGSGNDHGNGGDVKIAVTDDITVRGENAHGVFAQSVGGKGDNGDPTLAQRDSEGGDVSIEVAGDINASGKNGRAILAQSKGGTGNGNILIEIGPNAAVSTESQGRATILLKDGADNRLVNRGAIYKRDGGAGAKDEDFAIQVIDGSLMLENHGLLHGAISIDGEPGPQSGDTLIHNLPGGVMELTGVSRLKGDAVLRNDGTITAGALGKIGSARILGPGGLVTQDPDGDGSGEIWVDHQLGDSVSVAAKGDIIVIHNDAKLRGSVRPNLVGTNLVPSGTRGELRIVQLKPGRDITNNLEVKDTAAVNYQVKDIVHNGEPAIALAYEVNLAPWTGFALGPSDAGSVDPGDVGENTNHLTGYLGELIAARIDERRAIAEGGASAAHSAYAWVEDLESFLLGIENVHALLDTYEATVPSAHAAPVDASLIASIEFADALQSCRYLNEEGAARYVSDESCAWVRIRGSALQRDDGRDTSRFTETAFGFAGGADVEIAEGLTLGLAGSYERLFLSAENLEEGSGNRFQGGAFLSQRIDQWTFSTSVSGGTSGYDLTRGVITPGGMESASSAPRANFVAAHARVSHNFAFDGWSLEPTFDGGVHHLWRPGYAESGAEPYGIRFDDFQETVGTLNPFVKAEVDSTLAGAPIQLYGRAGLLGLVGAGDRGFDATFTGVPKGGPSFLLEDDVDSLYADLGLGLNVAVAENMSMNFVANTLLSGNTRAYAGSARFNIHF